MLTQLWNWLHLDFWRLLGFVGQVFFLGRFLVQWIATERQKRSVVPTAFWYLSMLGTIILLAYSIHQGDPVFIAGFSLNMIIYVRNLYFIHRKPVPAVAEAAAPSAVRSDEKS
jgi:lipid-A-disaccharide synthase-like uncharacterized protein